MEPLDSIQDELKAVAPYLASLPKLHPFKVPTDYFEWMEAKLSAVVAMKISGEGSTFDSKEHPFEVPENYFEELSSSIFSKIQNENQEEISLGRTVPLSNTGSTFRFLLAAASVALLVITSFFFFKQQPAATASANSNEVQQSDLFYAADIDDAVVVEMYLQDQQQNSQNASAVVSGDAADYLREAADIDASVINEL